MTANESFLAGIGSILASVGILAGYALFVRWQISKKERKQQ